MLRAHFFCLVSIIIAGLSGTGLVAQDNGSRLVFTGCPPYVEGNHCDSMFYQVVAIDIGTGKKCPEAKYFIVSGPGEINERTGLWLFHPGREDLPPHYQETVEIAAYKGHDTTTSDENCFFDVRVYDKFPRFEGYCGAHVTVLPGDTVVVPLEITDEDYCHDPQITSIEISPEPAGFFEFDATDWTVMFIPDDADEGRTFEVVTEVISGPMNISCRIFFDTFVPEPIKLRIATEEYGLVEPGDTVSVDIMVDAMPVDIDGMNLVIRFEDEMLSFLRAEPGADFFSPDSGCGWASIHPGWDYHCNIYPSRLIGLSIQATDLRWPPGPNCYRPDHFPAILASLEFVVTELPIAGEHFIPFDFYWCDCASNQLFSPKHDRQYFPTAVYDPEGDLIEPSWIPGPSGVLDWCFFNSFRNVERTRQVEFRNGGMRLDLPEPDPRYSVRIGQIEDQPQGQFLNLPITLETMDSAQGLAGFDFVLGYDAMALAFQFANEGAIYDSCGWEYFTFRYNPHDDCGTACPSGMLRVVGIAESNNGPYHPGCDVPFEGYVQTDQLPITLTTLRLLVSVDRDLAGRFVPVGFFWYDCRDNILSNFDGREAFLSSRVFNEHDSIISHEGDFPTWFGAQDECVGEHPMPGRIASRNVDYHNGGIGIIGPDPIDHTGDINMNGIPWEIADAVMFTHYFFSGLAAFGNHVEGSIAASDCNADGVALGVADFVYLIRVIIGDAQPCVDAVLSPNTARFSQDPDGVISVTTHDSLGAVYLVVEGNVTVTLLADNMDMLYAYDSSVTRILVYSFEANQFLLAGPIIALFDSSGIIELSTATFNGCPVESVVDGVTGIDVNTSDLPSSYALHQNYPNPFNPTTIIEYDLSKSSTVRLEIYNITGQKVRTLVSGQFAAGRQSVEWDGRDASGRRVSSGVYLYRLTAGEFVQTRKMLLLK